MLTNKQAEVELRAAEVHCLEERVLAAERDSESLHVAPVRFDDMPAELVSLAAGTGPAKAECDTLAACNRELEVAAVTHDRELGLLVRVRIERILRRLGLTRHWTRCPNFGRFSKG